VFLTFILFENSSNIIKKMSHMSKKSELTFSSGGFLFVFWVQRQKHIW
jgi:hypothetical protein